ncbi:NmrA family NAD(P)-binding protein [Lentilactobacillus buchneri]|uniref:NmrA-like protein n=1 Tax=Lentilactobacillus buchneri subsp. silagei CD034 TaxID=1071400 RepID=J9WAB0_LENBU|nr:NmrA family NAD(P)-binding protein [Lentilactobacillus buchneri]MCC6101589.1 NmrA family NAD(P)-binding protein [Lactobacillus sp.]AFS01011.1 NmrA-like protein [Lentilactobacillus buchneri subsp. silagei CD034]MCT2899856.1 NAD(P)-dependent oxidoreductase [Lentilactobacillus buchneri]MCT3542931.1 NAD(P)-dependent oxidoreductase [Lentilactobacillus buchneri]MCT3544370.1 NAD(P)-dependent oxidoreductase [Lentilactobacillus buchneri]
MRYIITGADGKLAGRVAELMLKEVSGEQLTFTCYKIDRVPKDKLKHWKDAGVRVVEADYNDKSSMLKAFEGGDRLYLISGLDVGKRVQQHRDAIDAAIEDGVKHISYTSFVGATEPAYQHIFVTPDHTATENYLESTGIDYTALRNNLYMETFMTMRAMLAFMSNNRWVTTAGEGKATLVYKDDCAKAGVASLLGKGTRKVYNIVGSESISVRQIADMISKRSGQQLEYVPASREEYYDYLAALNIPHDMSGDFSKSPAPFSANDVVDNDKSIADGLLDVKSDDIEELTGAKPKTPEEVIGEFDYIWKDHITNWRQMK